MAFTTLPRRAPALSWPLIASASLIALLVMIIAIHVLARTT